MRVQTLFSLLVPVLIAASGSVSAADRSFVRAALRSGVAEVQRAAIEANAADYRVRQFAGRMTTDHQTANQQLAAIASDIGVDTGSVAPAQPQPATTPGNGRPNVPAANPAPSAAIPYLRTEVKAHQEAIALFTREANGGTNPKLRAFAKQTLSTLRAHLRLAQTYLKQEEQLHR